MPHTMTRAAYAQMFGPTVGDKVRLADTDLIIEVEKDFTIYGEEVNAEAEKSFAMAWGSPSARVPRALSIRSSPTH